MTDAKQRGDECPQCEGPNIEHDDPDPGWFTCRDCGWEWERGTSA